MMKVGDKYIIEISERYETVEDWFSPNEDQKNAPCILYRIKGFNSLVFDQDGLNKLEKYEEQKKYDAEAEYQRGLDDAWECARKILNAVVPYDCWNMGGYNHISHAIKCYSASEAIEKIRQYEEQKKAEQEEVKVGDEVIPVSEVEVLNPSKGVVVCEQDTATKKIRVMWDDGSSGCWEKNHLQKTGRHFSEIAEVIKQLREGEG